LEDLIGAGALLAELPGTLSPEAELAASAVSHFRSNLLDTLSQCASGRELIELGYSSDIELASEYGISRTAPVLVGDRYVNDRVS
jgi:2-phosphosulfolactate phosphatase